MFGWFRRSQEPAPPELAAPLRGNDLPLHTTRASDEQIAQAALVAEVSGARSSSRAMPATLERSFQVPALWACLRVLTESLTSLPLVLYRRDDKGGRVRETAHPAARLMQQPDPSALPSAFRRTAGLHYFAGGNYYGRLQFNRLGQVERIETIPPGRVRPFRKDGVKWLRTWDERGKETVYHHEEMIHVPGLSYDGLRGLSALELATQTTRLAVGLQRMTSAWQESGGRLGVWVKVPPVQDQPTRDATKAAVVSWMEGGPEAAARVLALDESVDLQQLSLNPSDAEVVELSKLSVDDYCRTFGVPRHKLELEDRATHTNAEVRNREFLEGTLLGHLRAWEEAFTFALIRPEYREEFYFEHLVEGYLRADSDGRAQFYKIALDQGWLTLDDVLKAENLPTLGNDLGASRRVSLNSALIRPDGSVLVPARMKEGSAALPEGAPADSAPAATDTDSAAAAGEIQATAMNGAQVSALVALAQSVVAGGLPRETAKAIVATAFPLVTPAQIETIFGSLEPSGGTP
jgi:HK97 family phage portal protein